jgi:hypothetical protein
LRLNSIYCDDDPIISYEVFVFLGVIIGVAVAERRAKKFVIGAAILAGGVLILSRLIDLQSWSATKIEFLLIVPLQMAVGIILGVVFALLWTKFSGPAVRWIEKRLGV